MSETINDIIREMRVFADTDSQNLGRDVLRRRIQGCCDRIEAAYERELADALLTYNRWRRGVGEFAHKEEAYTPIECPYSLKELGIILERSAHRLYLWHEHRDLPIECARCGEEVRVDQVDEEGVCTWCNEEEEEASRHELQMDLRLKEYREGL